MTTKPVYTTQNDLLLNNLMDFYNKDKNMDTMLNIITGESKISLRIVDWSTPRLVASTTITRTPGWKAPTPIYQLSTGLRPILDFTTAVLGARSTATVAASAALPLLWTVTPRPSPSARWDCNFTLARTVPAPWQLAAKAMANMMTAGCGTCSRRRLSHQQLTKYNQLNQNRSQV